MAYSDPILQLLADLRTGLAQAAAEIQKLTSANDALTKQLLREKDVPSE